MNFLKRRKQRKVAEIGAFLDEFAASAEQQARAMAEIIFAGCVGQVPTSGEQFEIATREFFEDFEADTRAKLMAAGRAPSAMADPLIATAFAQARLAFQNRWAELQRASAEGGHA